MLGVRETRRLETERRLSQAAFDLAVERGVDGFTIDDVVAAAVHRGHHLRRRHDRHAVLDRATAEENRNVELLDGHGLILGHSLLVLGCLLLVGRSEPRAQNPNQRPVTND